MNHRSRSSAIVALVGACTVSWALTHTARAEAQAPPAPPMPAHGGMGDIPPGHPPMGGGGMGAPMGGMGMGGSMTPPVAAKPDAEGLIHAAGIKFALPSGWTSEIPSSGMRLVQAAIPGDKGKADLVVFHFGTGQGGDAQSNLDRWVAQVDSAEGTKPERDSFDVKAGDASYKVSTVTVPGTLKAGGMGVGVKEAQPGSRLLGAVIEGKGGPWFFKITGPDATVKDAQPAFVKMLKGLRPE